MAKLETLIQALGRRDWWARSEAAFQLGQLGPGGSAAVPALIEAIWDANGAVRCEVLIALGSIGDAAAVPSLVRVLEVRDWLMRIVASRALGRIGPGARHAIPALVTLSLRDPVVDVREMAALALRAIGDPVTTHSIKARTLVNEQVLLGDGDEVWWGNDARGG